VALDCFASLAMTGLMHPFIGAQAAARRHDREDGGLRFRLRSPSYGGQVA
jgi:hypothetical protein